MEDMINCLKTLNTDNNLAEIQRTGVKLIKYAAIIVSEFHEFCNIDSVISLIESMKSMKTDTPILKIDQDIISNNPLSSLENKEIYDKVSLQDILDETYEHVYAVLFEEFEDDITHSSFKTVLLKCIQTIYNSLLVFEKCHLIHTTKIRESTENFLFYLLKPLGSAELRKKTEVDGHELLLGDVIEIFQSHEPIQMFVLKEIIKKLEEITIKLQGVKNKPNEYSNVLQSFSSCAFVAYSIGAYRKRSDSKIDVYETWKEKKDVFIHLKYVLEIISCMVPEIERVFIEEVLDNFQLS